MEFGIVLLANYELIEPLQFTFNENTKEIPSSTRAELIVLAVLVNIIPRTLKITVNTDSQTLITVIGDYKNLKSRKHCKKYKNPLLLQIINEMITGKQIEIIFNKIKAHSGILLYNKVDELAKLGYQQSNLISLNIFASFSSRYHYEFNNMPVDKPITIFLSDYNVIVHLAKWKTQVRTVTTINKKIMSITNWYLSKEILMYSKIMNNHTNTNDGKFKSKCL